MDSFEKKLTKYTHKTRLTASERRELRERVLTYMGYHPLPPSMQSTSDTQMSFIARISTVYGRALAGAFAFILVVVSVPFVAERAVPGDMLYPVKTNFNESVLGQLADSPYDKISYETELMERRIDEARALAKSGRLTAEVEASIAMDVAGHARAAQDSIAALRVTNADEAAIAELTFSTVLDVHTAVFASSEDATDDIASAVRVAKENADVQKGTSTPSFTRLRTSIDADLEYAYELFSAVEDPANEEERAKIERRLADIERKIAEAQNIRDAGVSGDGIPELTTTLVDIKKLISFMTNIEVREQVDIETLVPVEYTLEEQRTRAEAQFALLQERRAYIAERIDALSEVGVEANVSDELETYFDEALEARASDDMEAFGIILEDIEATLTDMETRLGVAEQNTEEQEDAENASEVTE